MFSKRCPPCATAEPLLNNLVFRIRKTVWVLCFFAAACASDNNRPRPTNANPPRRNAPPRNNANRDDERLEDNELERRIAEKVQEEISALNARNFGGNTLGNGVDGAVLRADEQEAFGQFNDASGNLVVRSNSSDFSNDGTGAPVPINFLRQSGDANVHGNSPASIIRRSTEE
jgi:hypothetical protein